MSCWKTYQLSFILGFGLLISKTASSQVFEKRSIPFANPIGLIMEQEIGTNGVSVADYNQDGTLDIYFVVRDSTWGGDARTWNRLFALQDGSYVDQTTPTGLKGISQTVWSEMGFNIGASWGDYNNDGYPDLFLYYSGKDQLYKNNGDNTFTNVSGTAGFSGSETQLSSHGLWWDYDKDGDLDLYVTVRKDAALENRNSGNQMYENIGNDQFLEVSFVSNLSDSGLSYSALAFDANNDSHLDLYVANDFGENSLFLNNGDKTFTKDTENKFGLNDRGEGMGLAISDVDQNGFFDLYVTNVTSDGQVLSQRNPLFLNTGNNAFENNSESAGTMLAGWGWGTEFFDFDNDSDDDLFVSNGYFTNEYKNHFFENVSTNDSTKFSNIADSVGVADLAVSRTNVIFDQNDDGFLDLLISNFYEQPILYRNILGDGNWIKINLEGTITNRNAFGSVVEIETTMKTYRKYHHGAHFFGQNILPVHFGLGNEEIIDRITVYWMNGEVDEIFNIDGNQTITIKETVGLVTSNEHAEENIAQLPNEIILHGNYPNPFNAQTRIQFTLNTPGIIQLEVYDSIGRKVLSQSQIFSNAGMHTISLRLNNLNTGLYFYRVTTESSSAKAGKMLLLK